MVIVKGLPYVQLEDGTIAKMTSTFDANGNEVPAPAALDSRMNYNHLVYANEGLDNSKACDRCTADTTKSTDECAKFECKKLGQSTILRDGSMQVDGKRVKCDADSCMGANLKWAYNGLTARLETPVKGDLNADASYDVVIQINGQELFTTLKGDQMSFKLGAERSHLTGEANKELVSTSLDAAGNYDGCKVTLYEECHYKGTSHTYYPGHYPHSAKALDVASVQIEGNCKVRLYDLQDFGGQEKEFGRNQECIGGSLVEEFNTPIYDYTTVNGEYVATIVGTKKMAPFGKKSSLRVLSLDFDHFDYPTPYPTTFPTASPTFDLDMPACPVSCTYHEFAKDGKEFNNHKIHVSHSKKLLKGYNTFRAMYPFDEGKGPLNGGHTCWHEMPHGLDELQVYRTLKDGKVVTVNQDEARNHDEHLFDQDDAVSTDAQKAAQAKGLLEKGGCICRCT